MDTPHVIPLDHASPPRPALTVKLLLTVEEAGKLLGFGRTLMYDLLGSGELPSVQIGRLRRIRRADLELFVSQLTPSDTWTEGDTDDAPQETPRRHQSTQRSRQCLSGQRRTLARQGNHGRTRQRHT